MFLGALVNVPMYAYFSILLLTHTYMKRILTLSIGLLLLPLSLPAQYIAEGMGVPAFSKPTHNCISAEKQEEIMNMLSAQQKKLGLTARSEAEVTFIWPIRQGINFDEAGVYGISNFVDHNEAVQDRLLDYRCGGRTYDLENGYNHSGTDIFNWPFTWEKMDRDQVEVIAAAPGIIVAKEGGNKDKNCEFVNEPWNAVYVQHADGSTAWYGHLKRNSLTEKEIGDSVAAGEFLGIVGSSGSSTGPHLHFELRGPDQGLVDPFQGSCNPTSERSWWVAQPQYREPQINSVRVHSAEPVLGCYGSERPNEAINYKGGATVYFTAYFKDQLSGSTSTMRVLRPSGTIFNEWEVTAEEDFNASYWWRSFILPSGAELGEWTFEARYQGETVRTHFYLTNSSSLISAQLEMDTVFLGNLSEVTTLWKSFQITNPGNSGLEVESIETPNGIWAPWAGYIDAGETKTIHFQVSDATVNTLETITLRTNAGILTQIVAGGCSGIPYAQQRVLCSGDSFDFGDQLITTAGTYQATFTAVDGCDSVVNLTVLAEDAVPEINQEIGLLTLDLGNEVTYQWIQCDDPGNLISIRDANGPTYVPTVYGAYAVQVTQGSCTFTSNCVNVTILDLAEPTITNLKLYPNPSSGNITLALPDGATQGQYWVVDTQGRRVLEGTIQGVPSVSLQLPASSGLYGVYFQDESGAIARGTALVR
ncbi:MAG TPA: hypothetical protein DCE41_13920 [Cytophagales bacterium]|nr:hypothetical protein [Cytophagales bacterium]